MKFLKNEKSLEKPKVFVKAVSLFSGGLDSLLAIKLIQQQNIDVTAVAFRSPFFVSDKKMQKMQQVAKQQGFKIKFINLGMNYLKMVKKPKHGHGKNMNPCIDCHAYMIKKAKAFAKKINAKFIFTGEVLDERPMSQNRKSLDIVAQEAGLKNKLLRPLSAKLLPETEAEEKAYVDRQKLMNLRGRSRKRQFALAKKFKITNYETPAGGCLLTCEAYSKKLKDLFNHKFTINDVKLLKLGRHFRFRTNKIIVGRNLQDNQQLLKQKNKTDYVFEAKDIMGPTTLLQGKKTKKAILIAAQLTARYSDAKTDKVTINYNKKEIIVESISDEELERLRI